MTSEGGAPRAGESVSHWIALFVVGNAAAAIVVVASGYVDTPTADTPTWVFALSAAAMWAVSLYVVRRFVTSRSSVGFRRGIGLVFRPADSWGIAIGLASQLVLVNLVNWPLGRLFPDTFNFEEVSRRATDLTDASTGAWIALLGAIVVVGAPFVEEIVYRGMVQPGLMTSWGPRVGTIVTAILFAAIHFVPVEFPGLFAFALVLGWARNRTGTLGLAIVTHMAFNAAGLGLALLG